MTKRAPESLGDRRTPLASSVLYILIALAAGPRRSRDIAAEVRRISAATVSERTTRRLLGRMRDLDVVTNPPGRSESGTTEFELTPFGIAILRDEITRLKSLIDRLDVEALCQVAPSVRNS